MAYLSVNDFRFEVVEKLRNAEIFSVSDRGVTRVSESFSGDGSTTSFTLSNTPVHNIKSLTVDGAAQRWGFEFTYDRETGVVTFSSAPPSGTDNVVVQYDYGSWSEEKIFWGYPKRPLRLGKFPRLSAVPTSVDTKTVGLGSAPVERSKAFVDLLLWASDPVDYVDLLRAAVLDNKSSWYSCKTATINFLRGPVASEGLGNEILQLTVELKVDFEVEK